MQGPDYTHWHGTYEVARNFYSELIPELEELVEKGHASDDPALHAAADNLRSVIDKVLSSDDHKWYLGQMDPAEKARRDAERENFKERHK